MFVLLKQEEANIRYKYARTHIPNAVFYIPFTYYYVVRIGTVPKLLSWALIYILPTAFYAVIGYDGSVLLFCLQYLFTLIATFSLYELGYIFNDTVAIHREQQPAIRLYDHNFSHFAQYKVWIIIARIAYSCAAIMMLLLLQIKPTSVLQIAISLVLMCGLFAVYNTWRNRYNVWFYPLLVCSRYLPFMLLCEHNSMDYILLILAFPLLNALERFSMPKYRWHIMRALIPNEESKTLFRVSYYVVILLILFPTMYFYDKPLLLLIPIVLIGAYRLGLLFILKYHKPKNYLNG